MRTRSPLPRWTLAGLLGLAAGASLAAEESVWIEPFARLASSHYRVAVADVASLRGELAGLPETPQFQQSERLGFEIPDFLRLRPPGPLQGWIEIDLGRAEPLDAVVLVPVDAPWRDFPGPGYGFPARFKVEADGGAGLGLVADYTRNDFPNPGGLPVWIPAHGERLRRVRITLTRPWRHGPAYSALAFGEIMLISGNRNLAARLPPSAVQVSESFESLRVWSRDNLIDGQSVLGAPVGSERRSTLGYHSAIADRADAAKWVQVDLGGPVPVDEIRLIGFSATQLAGRPGFGFPVRFKVELSDEPGFAAPRLLFDQTKEDFPNPAANPVTIVADGARGRYVRVTATKLWERGQNFAFALSELQVYAGGRNVALGQPVTALDSYSAAARENPSLPPPQWAPQYLTDGFTAERRLMEWPEFLRGLSRRREALAELAVAERTAALARAAAVDHLTKAAMAAGLVAAIAAAVTLQRARRARRRALERLRQQIAADLHDEIGSNLGSIALLSEIGLHRDGQIARSDLEEIRSVARQTSDSMRDIVDLIQRPGTVGNDFVATLRKVAERMLAGLEWTFQIGAPLELPSLAAQRHLLLAFKEALHNIRKHAAARRVSIELQGDKNRLCLRIADDGAGFDPARTAGGHGLASLRQRAAALGGELEIRSQPGQGTTIALHLNARALRAARFR